MNLEDLWGAGKLDSDVGQDINPSPNASICSRESQISLTRRSLRAGARLGRAGAYAAGVSTRKVDQVVGEIAAEASAEKLANDPDAQRRYLGVEPLAAH